MIRTSRHCPPRTPGSANHLTQCHLQHFGDLGGKRWRTETPRKVDNASSSPASRRLSEPVAGRWAPGGCCGPQWKARLGASRTSPTRRADAPEPRALGRLPGPPAARTSGEWREPGLPTRHRPAGSQLTRDSRCLVAGKSRRLPLGARGPAVPSALRRAPSPPRVGPRGAPKTPTHLAPGRICWV